MELNIQLRQPGVGPNFIGAGKVDFAASSSEAVVFNRPLPEGNSDYVVVFSSDQVADITYATPTRTGFTINTAAPITGEVSFTLIEVTQV